MFYAKKKMPPCSGLCNFQERKNCRSQFVGDYLVVVVVVAFFFFFFLQRGKRPDGSRLRATSNF